ncbi:MAG: RluA family pseudouridine synthase [Thermodesulfobacteriota bacterium]
MAESTRRPPSRHRPRGLEILYDDRYILVISKETGILSMSFHRDQNNTVERILTDYVRKGCSRSKNRVFVVHRLDRDSSGLMVFAKTYLLQQRLKKNWDKTEKLYLAAVHGHVNPASGIIESNLTEDKDQFVSSTDDPSKGRPARTGYRVIKQTRLMSIVKIKLYTGRKNQIRVHFAEKGYPVIGDRKYGRPDKPYERLALHAKSLAFNHPQTGERMRFNTEIPAFFPRIAGGLDESDWGKPYEME